MEKHAVSRLTGAPPGYVGYEEGGVLTNRVRHKPYSVVLFDEVEKAHPDVFNIFLQMLDDGRLTDSQGHVVSFVNTIILLTSNLGSQFIHPVSTPEEEIEMQANIMEAVRGHFRPEFLNRLDEVLIFKQLSLETMRPIVDIQLRRLVQRLSEKTIELEVSDEARDLLATWGFDPNYGARPLKRVIQSRLQDTLSDMLLRGELVEKSTVRVGTNPETNSLTFEVWS
jgi:ATP-dependent Clp protease ATP-binding subunit ClpB